MHFLEVTKDGNKYMDGGGRSKMQMWTEKKQTFY